MTSMRNSPRAQGSQARSRVKIDSRLREAAALLKATPYLDPHPAQGACRAASSSAPRWHRAIVKNASLVLARTNRWPTWTYKLRDELRAELPRIFAAAGTIFVYATTRAALSAASRGNTQTLSEGPITRSDRPSTCPQAVRIW